MFFTSLSMKHCTSLTEIIYHMHLTTEQHTKEAGVISLVFVHHGDSNSNDCPRRPSVSRPETPACE